MPGQAARKACAGNTKTANGIPPRCGGLGAVQAVACDIVGDGRRDQPRNGLAVADPLSDVGAADVQKRGGNAAGENLPDRFFAYRLAEGTKVVRFWAGSG